MKSYSFILAMSIIFLFSCSQPKKGNNTSTSMKEATSNNVVEKKVAIFDTTFTFEESKLGELPNDWSQSFTGRGEFTNWKVVDDKGNKVLAQLSLGESNYHFNNIVFNGLESKNMELKVRMKGVKGYEDQGGGFIWRYIDKDNYYVVRANPLEDNVVLYKVKKGRRSDLPLVGKGKTYGVDVPTLGKGWNDLTLNVDDNIFTVFLNGKELFKVNDDTFQGKGKIGLWTKADAVSYFDDYQVTIFD